MKKLLFSSLVCACALGYVSAARTQSDPLSLQEALDQAARSAPLVLAKRAAMEAAQLKTTPAGQLPDPELIVGVDNLPITGSDAGSLTSDFMTMRKVGVMQTFTRQAKRELRTKRAENEVDLAQAQATSAILDVKREVAIAWIAVQSAENTLEALRKLQPILETRSRSARAAISSAQSSAAVGLETQNALLLLRDRIFVAEQNVKRARTEFGRWLPEDASRPLGQTPDFTRLATNELLANVHHHASLAKYEVELAAAQNDIELAKADKHPDWSVGLTYQKRGPAYSDMVSMEVRVPLPLFAGRRQDPTIAAKRAEVRTLEAERDAELRMHRSEIEQMIADWDALKSRLALYKNEISPLARERVRIATSAVAGNAGNTQEALDAHAAEIEVELQIIELEAALGRAWAGLNFLSVEGARHE
jgi:cobalt-zinc-cadmium efflux system outer membrane protein